MHRYIVAKLYMAMFQNEEVCEPSLRVGERKDASVVYLGLGIGEQQHAMHSVHLVRRRKAFHG